MSAVEIDADRMGVILNAAQEALRPAVQAFIEAVGVPETESERMATCYALIARLNVLYMSEVAFRLAAQTSERIEMPESVPVRRKAKKVVAYTRRSIVIDTQDDSQEAQS